MGCPECYDGFEILEISMTFTKLVFALSLPCGLLAQGGFSGPGAYEITNIKSGKVLDLDRNDQVSVIQFSPRNTDNQVWMISRADSGYYYIRNGMNGNALEATGGNSSPLRATPLNGRPAQQWRIEPGKDGNALITNRTGKTLDIPDGTSRDGARVQIYDPNGDSNQRFTFRPVSGRGGNFGGPGNGRGPDFGRPGNFGGGAARVTCSSDNGSRVYCQADTSGSVQMVRQVSGSPCRQGETWGYDRRGIWVDRGCRAEFETAPAGMYRGGDRGQDSDRGDARTVICSSDSGRRVRCDADTRRGVRLVRQIGGTCREGQTWGFDERGIWVDRGCQAEFVLGR